MRMKTILYFKAKGETFVEFYNDTFTTFWFHLLPLLWCSFTKCTYKKQILGSSGVNFLNPEKVLIIAGTGVTVGGVR